MSSEIEIVLLSTALRFHILLLRLCPSDNGDSFDELELVPAQVGEGRWTNILYLDSCTVFVPLPENILVFLKRCGVDGWSIWSRRKWV